ncbi:TatD family hydrolase [Marinobacter mobilis]|uniref:TatD family hydrolase n=1 Tax=Marinobacter mobilis TaxID=488533 RepID=UPI0035C6C412
MELVDAHCHFDFPEFDGQRASTLAQMTRLGVTRLVIPGVRKGDWFRVIETASMSDRLSYCLGIHPWFIGEHADGDLDLLRRLLVGGGNRCVALGECGLDRLRGDLSQQLPWFERQVGLAAELELPLVIHSVRAHEEVCAVLRRAKPEVPILVHGFSGSADQAKKLVALGCLIGVGGVITHVRARKTREAIAGLPLETLVLETDAPDMAPEGVAKGKNSPLYLPRIFEVLTALRPEPVEELAMALTENTRRLFGWDKGISK